MKEIVPYLFFNGKCRDAMNFYRDCLGGELQIMTYADAPPDENFAGDKDAVMHSNLKSENFTLMASDSVKEGAKFGSNVQLSIDCSSIDEIEDLFNKIGKGATILFPLQDTFWGARFGMMIDQFGIHWMFNYDKK